MANTGADAYVPVVDISQYQSRLDAAAMAAAGVAALVLRSSKGAATVDTTWAEFLTAARRSPLLVGAYHFLRPQESDPATQARFWLRTVRSAVEATGRPLDLPLMADVEQYWTTEAPLPGPAMATWLRAFLAVVEDESGDLVRPAARIPTIYTGAPFWNAYVAGDAGFGRHGLVLARYPTQRRRRRADGTVQVSDQRPPTPATAWPAFAWGLTPDPAPALPPGWDRWDGWQFSADGNGAGASVGVGSTDVDCNIFRADSIRRWTAPDAAPPTGTRPVTPTEALVQSLPLVRPGDRGDAVRRVQALLLAAGFDPGELDGVYGTAPQSPTGRAVRAFQAAHRLDPDGRVGVGETWPALLGLGTPLS